MDNVIESKAIWRYTSGHKNTYKTNVVKEVSFQIEVNGRELTTVLCTPYNIEYLVCGLLYSEGLIENKNNIVNLEINQKERRISSTIIDPRGYDKELEIKRIIASSGRCNSVDSDPYQSIPAISSQLKVSVASILVLVAKFQKSSDLYLSTRGVHSAALCADNGILVFDDDIGRHNAIDKVFGKCLMCDIDTHERIMITSGRISSEIMHKVIKWNVPILISLAVPTNFSIGLAEKKGVTVIGSVDGETINVYTNPWRVTFQAA